MTKSIITLLLVFAATLGYSQTKNFSEPYLETFATADTLISPDRVYLSIKILEKDTRGKISVEELERKMVAMLKSSGIDIEKQLTLLDLASNFGNYFLKKKEVLKNKSYSLLVYSASEAGKVIMALEKLNISNVNLDRTEYSKIKSLKLLLKTKAVLNAKTNAVALVKGLNQKIGNATVISDITYNYARNYSSGARKNIVIRGYSSINAAHKYEDDENRISFEKIKIGCRVSVVFRLE